MEKDCIDEILEELAASIFRAIVSKERRCRGYIDRPTIYRYIQTHWTGHKELVVQSGPKVAVNGEHNKKQPLKFPQVNW
jgi:hypothetical protein